MRVGLVTDFYYPWIGGPSAVIRNLGQGLSAVGHDVFVLAPSPDGRGRTERDSGLCITRARTIPFPLGFGLRVAHRPLRDAGVWLDEVRPDVVHVHHPFPLSAAAILTARRRDIRVVATNHTVPECTLWGIKNVPLVYPTAYKAFGLWVNFLLGRCDCVATPTQTAANMMRAMGYRGHVTPISNGVDTGRFAPRAPDHDLRLALDLDGRPVVLYTGRLDADKDVETWFRAAEALARQMPVQFVIGGKGTARAWLEREVERAQLSEQVRFPGYLSDADFPRIYNLADIYFITSPVELQSISTLEALASGLPVVGVRAGALPELVTDGVNGALVEPGDWESAAAALAGILADDTRRSEMGHASHARAAAHDLKESVAAYEQFLGITEAPAGAKERRERPAAFPG